MTKKKTEENKPNPFKSLLDIYKEATIAQPDKDVFNFLVKDDSGKDLACILAPAAMNDAFVKALVKLAVISESEKKK
jgi:hypothetical protein